MIDTKLNKFLKPTLNEIAKLLIKFGFKANFVTTFLANNFLLKIIFYCNQIMW